MILGKGRNLKQGIYRSVIEISVLTDEGKPVSQQADIYIKVFDYTLPRTFNLRTAISFNPHKYNEFYSNKINLDEDKRKEIYQFLLNYRLNPTCTYSEYFPPLEDWQWCIDRGANAFNLYYLEYIDPGKRQEFEDTLKNKIVYLKEHGLAKYAYIFAFDELKRPYYTKFKEMVSLVRNIDSHIPIACDIPLNQELKNYINIWIPPLEDYDSLSTMQIKKADDEIWWFTCCFPLNGYPNFFIERPAVTPRIMFWLASKYDISGFFYWETVQWYANYMHKNLYPVDISHEDSMLVDKIKQGYRWPDIPWNPWNNYCAYRFNGDGQLIYPWKNGELIPSIRLINLRDGIEDCEMLYQLKQLRKHYEKENKRAVISEIDRLLEKAYSMVPKINSYEDNPDKLLETKKEAGIILEKYNK